MCKILTINNSFKILFVFLMTGLILVHLSKYAIIMSWYNLNKEAITNKYCVNIDKPVLKCNGKCHIKKIISNDLGKSQKSNFTYESTLEINLFLEEVKYPTFIDKKHSSKLKSTFYTFDFYSLDIISKIDHPPQV